MIFEAISVAFAISIDTLVVSIGYGTSKIKIPFLSAFIMSFCNILMLCISIFIGSLIGDLIEINIAKIISFALLFTVGLFKFFSEIIKIFLTKKSKKGLIKIKLFNFNLFLSVIADTRKADTNHDKILSPWEAITLGIILSIDSLGVGFVVGMTNLFLEYFILFSFLLPLIFIPVGSLFGKFISKKINLSWLSGIILIGLGILKLI